MTSDVQQEALAVLAQVLALSPDVRLGQLLTHLGFLGEAYLGRDLGYLEDDEIVAILYRHKSELEARLESERSQTPELPQRQTSISGSPISTEGIPTAEMR